MSQLPWFRMFTEVRGDAKLRTLKDNEFRAFINLLCFAAEQSIRGQISGYSPQLLAVEICNADVTLCNTLCNTLVSLRIATVSDNFTITFINFEKRHMKKPSDAPEKVRERVAKSRKTRVKSDVTPCNTDVTPGIATDRDRDRDLYIETNTPLPPKGDVISQLENSQLSLMSNHRHSQFNYDKLSKITASKHPTFELMLSICKINPRATTNGDLYDIVQTITALGQEGISPMFTEASLKAWHTWFKTDDWRGRDSQKIQGIWIMQTWPQFANPEPKTERKANGRDTELRPEVIAALASQAAV